ncbi:hypothetical protein B7P43_G17421 [Cryptotermes secundus]|uniref:PiggyBac transposable element-derived protein domain-containing protein n=1 Tax=Cryptotermes secundus TaxID=105785 RepID=A0A2J7R4E2_9NEOP|nr:hypothetical protein B7P43_G17421 [Cryptotermes secundus]
MVSTIHNSSMVDVQRRHGQVKKPLCISEYNMFMKGVDRADQFLAYYSLPRKTVKWTKKVALWLINCAIFNSFTVFKKVNRNSTLKYKAFLLKLAKAWATDVTVAAVPASDTDVVQPGPSVRTRRRLQVDTPGQLSGDMRKHIYENVVRRFNAKVGREDLFKPTIGNESLHEISNDNGVGVIDFATSKNLTVKSTKFPHRIIHKFTWTSSGGKIHNQIDHILIDRRWHSSILDVPSFRAADCDTDHYLVVAKVRETGSEQTNNTQSSYGEVQSQEIK